MDVSGRRSFPKTTDLHTHANMFSVSVLSSCFERKRLLRVLSKGYWAEARKPIVSYNDTIISTLKSNADAVSSSVLLAGTNPST